MAANQKLIRALRKALRDLADPAKAPVMQAYMKSAMPYLGIQAVPFRKAAKAVLAAHSLDSFEDWRDTALALWRSARYREERYAVVELVGYRSYEKFRTLDALPLYEELISTGAWWDYVDSIASNRLGELLGRYPKELRAILREWAVSDDLWKRRSAILAQLGFKADTDLKLLYDCIRPSLDRPEFFLRKAIGWALRQHAWTDPKEVVRFVKAHEKRLSPLSKREALKNISRA
jgi:3-methyladenine DNA glycosylase AlkD